ncbi:hypothetical protein PISL3812_08455 [Talaromyces islandicus]|uniref:Uncharacterized protein n=1 Tax=Talaromyces islandicus TaxID=28573 RepID=A0A0U1M772_TALIS|nr:hypothetical protein PISL3812_08455 [Talaromyces islandicus]
MALKRRLPPASSSDNSTIKPPTKLSRLSTNCNISLRDTSAPSSPARKWKGHGDTHNTRPVAHLLPCQRCFRRLVDEPNLECSGPGSNHCARCKSLRVYSGGCREVSEEQLVLAQQTLEKVRARATGWERAVVALDKAMRRYSSRLVKSPSCGGSLGASTDSSTGSNSTPTPVPSTEMATKQSSRFDPELARLMNQVQDATRALDDYMRLHGYT